MRWKVEYSKRAREELWQIISYFVTSLGAEKAAADFLAKVEREVASPDEMPMRYALYAEEPWRSRGLRYFSVGRYLVFYSADEAARTVVIHRILYGGRDISRQLDSDK